MNPSDILELSRRLARLERMVRLWRRLGICAMLVTFVALLLGGVNGQAQLKVLDVGRLSLRDGAGNARLTMATTEAGLPLIELFDGNGKARLMLSLADDGAPSVAFYGVDKRSMFVMGCNANNEPVILLRDKQARSRLSIGVGPSGSPSINLLDDSGVPRLSMMTSPNGSASLSMLNSQGQSRFTASLGDEESILSIYDESGKNNLKIAGGRDGFVGLTLEGGACDSQAALAMGKDEKPSILLNGNHGQNQLLIGSDKQRGPMFIMSDLNQKARLSFEVIGSNGIPSVTTYDKNGNPDGKINFDKK